MTELRPDDQALFEGLMGAAVAYAEEALGDWYQWRGQMWGGGVFPVYPDREALMTVAATALRFSDVQALEVQGIDRATLAGLTGRGVIGRLWVREMAVRDGAGGTSLRWERAETKESGAAPRLIVAVREGGALDDMVALSSADPMRWSLLTGEGVLLGQDLIDRAIAFAGAVPPQCETTARVVGQVHFALRDGPSMLRQAQHSVPPQDERDWVGARFDRVRLFSNPWRWLAGGCDGICVLQWGRAALNRLRMLGKDVTLVADDAAAAGKLAELLRHGALPVVDFERDD